MIQEISILRMIQEISILRMSDWRPLPEHRAYFKIEIIIASIRKGILINAISCTWKSKCTHKVNYETSQLTGHHSCIDKQLIFEECVTFFDWRKIQEAQLSCDAMLHRMRIQSRNHVLETWNLVLGNNFKVFWLLLCTTMLSKINIRLSVHKWLQ